MHRWREHARRIPDPRLREDALDSLERKRTHADGAALFWVLPRSRNPGLLRTLVAYEIILDFLDNVNERALWVGETNGRQLHRALIEAVDPDVGVSDYYRYHPWKDDGGYLGALVGACRAGCVRLPSYGCVRELVVAEARRAQVLALNHVPDPEARERLLKEWVVEEFPEREGAAWFELSGAASASLTIHALLALAAEPVWEEGEVWASYRAYLPWISTTSTLLDSYVDQGEDLERGAHSYVSHYESSEVAVERLGELIRRSACEARRLRRGHRHAVIVACMVAMYLSRDSAQTVELATSTRRLVEQGGSLTKLLMPVLRLWRIFYKHGSA